MQSTKGTLLGQRSFRLIYATSLPDEAPSAVVVLVHGYGEHMGRYKHVVAALVERGYAVYTIDHRGHGESQGPRASVEHFEYFVRDLDLLVDRARAEHPTLPLFMLGHSMGGLIAVHYALRHQDAMTGLVLSGPALQVGDDVSPMMKRLAAVVARVAPLLPLAPATKSAESTLSRDPLVQETLDADPLSYKGNVRARIGYEIMRAAANARQSSHLIRLPLLVMYGDEDRLTNPSGAQHLYNHASSTDKTIKPWPGCRHEIFNEPEKDEVIAFVADWIDERLVAQGHQIDHVAAEHGTSASAAR